MMNSKISFFLVVLSIIYCATCLAAQKIEVLIPDHKAKLAFQAIDDKSLLVTVSDEENNPVRGLEVDDFVIQSGRKKAKIVSVEPLERSEFVPLNIVLVIDNSFSMRERRAIKPLLAAMDEFFKTLRPIDNVSIVVFDDERGMKAKAYNLHAKAYRSSFIPEQKKFLKEAFDRGLTSRTYLYEAMVAGISIIKKMPKEQHKFLVVFSDGEDLNSAIKTYVVESEAHGIENFEAFCIDYMPRPKKDPFLKAFAENHNGRIWKAKSASELLPIFQSFSTTLLYRYIVTYKFFDPPHGTLRMEPAALNFDMLTMLDGSPIMNKIFFETGSSEIPESYVLLKSSAHKATFDGQMLTTSLERYKNVLNIVGKRLSEYPEVSIRIIGCNSDTGIEKGNLDLSQGRAETVKKYLQTAWRIDPAHMKVEARNLPAKSTPTTVLGSRPENQRVEILYASKEMDTAAGNQFIAESSNRKEIKLSPQIVAEYGIADWELTILADNQTVKTLKGTEDLQPHYTLSLDEIGRQKLATCTNLQARIKVTDINQDSYETATTPCPIKVSKKELIHEFIRPPQGTVSIEPEKVTIEEVTTIDSSPLLNYVFFETGQSDIPSRYITFPNQADTNTFNESQLKGTMDKYRHILNIIGQRLKTNPEARIKIVGCNSNRNEEYNRKDLSRSRAESVRSYLKYIWGIDSSRMELEVRNLPAVASANSVNEGRVENQRVEIYSDSPALLDTIKSTYVEKISNTEEVRILPQIKSGYDLARWTIALIGDGSLIESTAGQGDLLPIYQFNLKNIGLSKIGAFENIGANLEVEDKKGQIYKTYASTTVRLIKREERVAKKEGYKVVEKYALILFNFDRADIKDRNQVVLDRIVARIKEVPSAKVTIEGHTDTIGHEAYNLQLSNRRAKAAYDMILAGGVNSAENVTYVGAGPHNPLFDNNLPEGRALNRTVTVTLEYEQKQ
jgi:outer membrane protein OmpA-like peptidoglycan-associated protein